MLRQEDLMDAVEPGSRVGLSLKEGIRRLLSPIEDKCLRRGFVDKNPMDLRSTSRDIVIALGSAELTLSTGEGIRGSNCDVVGEGSCWEGSIGGIFWWRAGSTGMCSLSFKR